MDKNEQDKIYKILSEEYTDDEIAESFIFSTDLTDNERIVLSKKLKNKRDNMTISEKENIDKFIKKLNKNTL